MIFMAFSVGLFIVGVLQFLYYPHRAALSFRNMERALSQNNFVRAKEEAENTYSYFPYFRVYEKYYKSFR